MQRRVLPLVVVLTAVSACGKDSPAPTNPTPPPGNQATRIMSLEGDLNFGNVDIGKDAVRPLKIRNTGTETLTVTGMNSLYANEVFFADWTKGAIAPGGVQDLIIRFAPLEPKHYAATLTVQANHTGGTNTKAISGFGIGVATRFGPGQWRINEQVAPGRYFADPDDGCYWERQKGFSGELDDIIANDFLSGDYGQAIIDILGSDRAIDVDADCGDWTQSPVRGHSPTISTGTWLVGSQITPGTYTATVSDGCYWERQRNFQGTLSAIISNDFVSTGGTRSVTIRSSDVGFTSDEECGTWSRTGSSAAPFEASREQPDIEANWRRRRERDGLR